MNIETANRLQTLRKQNGYSQEELANILGISRQAISKWETAESSPDTDNLIALAKLYNISLDELLNVESIKSSNDSNINQTVNKLETDGLTNDDEDENKENKNKSTFEIIYYPIVIALSLGAYLIWGLAFDGWNMSWLVFIYMATLLCLPSFITSRQITSFPIPLVITSIYLTLGMSKGLWHPWWCLYILVPIFYIISGPIVVFAKKKKKVDDNKK